MSDGPDLRLVGWVDEVDVGRRLSELRHRHYAQQREAWIGALAMHFTNDEIRVLSDALPIVDGDDLRRLGLIGADEGYDGTKECRKRLDARRKARWEARRDGLVPVDPFAPDCGVDRSTP